jgi:hypothetical protein
MFTGNGGLMRTGSGYTGAVRLQISIRLHLHVHWGYGVSGLDLELPTCAQIDAISTIKASDITTDEDMITCSRLWRSVHSPQSRFPSSAS